jgi:hypothetical protein
MPILFILNRQNNIEPIVNGGLRPKADQTFIHWRFFADFSMAASTFSFSNPSWKVG